MTNKNDTAFPCISEERTSQYANIPDTTLNSIPGLSKIELFTALAMQGICASGFLHDQRILKECADNIENIQQIAAEWATSIAEKTITALNQSSKVGADGI